MTTDRWSDLVCPWCAVGRAHPDAALARSEHADVVVPGAQSPDTLPATPRRAWTRAHASTP